MLRNWYTRQMPEGWDINFQPQIPDFKVSTMKRKGTTETKAKQNLTILSEAKALWRNFVREGSPATQMKSYCFTLKTEHFDKPGQGYACYVVKNEKKYWSPRQTLVFSRQCYWLSTFSSLFYCYKHHVKKSMCVGTVPHPTQSEDNGG